LLCALHTAGDRIGAAHNEAHRSTSYAAPMTNVADDGQDATGRTKARGAPAAAAPGAGSMDVFTAMRKRRMHRVFEDRPVEPELLDKLVYAAGRAPVVRANLRHIVVVTDPRLMRAVRVLSPGFLNNAPALMAICSDIPQMVELIGERAAGPTAAFDCGAAAGYMSVAAPALGLGICVVTSWTPPAMRPIFDLPEHVEPYVLMAVGYPIPNPPKAPPRFQPIVHQDRFGTPYERST
jgi:nitroreductase